MFLRPTQDDSSRPTGEIWTNAAQSGQHGEVYTQIVYDEITQTDRDTETYGENTDPDVRMAIMRIRHRVIQTLGLQLSIE